MTDTRLHEQLAHLVEGVDSAPMAVEAWRRAGLRRRRRRASIVVLGSVTAVVVVLGLGLDSRGRPQQGHPEVPAGTASVAATLRPARPAVSLVLGEPASHARLPVRPGLLRALDDVPTDAPDLRTLPADRLVAAVQRTGREVFALGSDGRWRVVSAGPGARLAEISPDGRFVALTSADSVDLVDARTGDRRAVPLDTGATGELYSLRWLSDGSGFLAGGDDGAVHLDATGSRWSPSERWPYDVAVAPPGRLVTLESSGIRIADGPLHPLIRRNGKIIEAWTADWYGNPVSDGQRVARAFFTPENEAQAVAVVDVDTGELTHLLEAPYVDGRSQGCCGVLGWLDDGSLLFVGDGLYLLAWNPESGLVSRVARLENRGDTTVVLAPGQG